MKRVIAIFVGLFLLSGVAQGFEVFSSTEMTSNNLCVWTHTSESLVQDLVVQETRSYIKIFSIGPLALATIYSETPVEVSSFIKFDASSPFQVEHRVGISTLEAADDTTLRMQMGAVGTSFRGKGSGEISVFGDVDGMAASGMIEGVGVLRHGSTAFMQLALAPTPHEGGGENIPENGQGPDLHLVHLCGHDWPADQAEEWTILENQKSRFVSRWSGRLLGVFDTEIAFE